MAFALPYAFAQTVEDYERAGLELSSPLSHIQANIEAGQLVYDAMCTQCHGVEGKGDGALSRNGHIAGIPSYSDKLKDLAGRQDVPHVDLGQGPDGFARQSTEPAPALGGD